MSVAGNNQAQSLLALLLLVAFSAACSSDEDGGYSGGVACSSAVGWYVPNTELQGATELDVTACLATRCFSERVAVVEGNAMATCPAEDTSELWYLSACAFTDADQVRMEVSIRIADAATAELEDGDDASLVVASPDGTTLYEKVSAITYRVNTLDDGVVCKSAYVSD